MRYVRFSLRRLCRFREGDALRTRVVQKIEMLSCCATLHKLLLHQSPLPAVFSKPLAQQAVPPIEARGDGPHGATDDLANFSITEFFNIREPDDGPKLQGQPIQSLLYFAIEQLLEQVLFRRRNVFRAGRLEQGFAKLNINYGHLARVSVELIDVRV